MSNKNAHPTYSDHLGSTVRYSVLTPKIYMNYAHVLFDNFMNRKIDEINLTNLDPTITTELLKLIDALPSSDDNI
jgi:hypothetical protein